MQSKKQKPLMLNERQMELLSEAVWDWIGEWHAAKSKKIKSDHRCMKNILSKLQDLANAK